MSQQVPSMQDLEPMVEKVLRVSEPPEDLTLKPGAPAVVVGYLNRCRRLLQGLSLLNEAGLGDAGDPLVRTTLDLAATAVWLMKEPEPRLDRLIAGMLHDLHQVNAYYEQVHGRPVPDDDFSKTFAEAEARGIASKAMLGSKALIEEAELTAWYVPYRLMSMRSHGTLLSATMGTFDEELGQLLVRSTPATSAIGWTYVAVAMWMTLKLTELANEALKWGRDAEIQGLVEQGLALVKRLP